MAEPPSSDTIFCAAIDITDERERAAYIARACGDDQELRARVEKLVAAHFRAGSFLEQPLESAQATRAFDPSSLPHQVLTTAAGGPSRTIGPYKLVEEIGEGGMGTVYLAQQTEPVKRLVALKVIKPGMDSRQVIARFEAERQALALMDHPHIARVLDAGTTEEGRPYFVMELVKGVPITRYCDEQRLSPRQRLELFIPVCQAVQHAHHKGIIHRDIKPSNVLVALYDGQPVPKVIDFGVAKATGQPLTDKTLVTGFGSVVGTLEYMSPEQAELNQLDVDTRSDIYSLGVVLYELLTGTTPLEKKRLKQAAMLEVLRVIREEEPPTPSTRLSTTDQLPRIAAARGLEPRQLSGLVRGELDWLVMKALDKDRGRRYETANDFALDIQRYLADEPVLAGPPSRTYRLRKFLRRNRGPVLAAALLLLALVGGIIGTTVGLVWEKQARAEAQNATQKAENALRAEVVERDEKEKASQRELNEKGQRIEALRGWRKTAYFRQIALVLHEYRANNLAQAEALLDQCATDLRRWEWYYLKRLCHAERSRVELKGAVTYRRMLLSPDGKRLALYPGTTTVLPDGATACITQALGAQALAPAGAPLGSLARLALAAHAAPFHTPARTIRLFDSSTGNELHTFLVHNHWPRDITFSADGRWIASAGNDRSAETSVRVWNILTGEELPRFQGADHWGYGQAPPDVVVGLRYALMQGGIAGQALAPAGGGLALGTHLSFVAYQVAPLDLMSLWPGPLTQAALSGDGRLVAGTDNRGRLQVWDRVTGQQLFRRDAHPIVNENTRWNNVWTTYPVFSPDGKWVATACSDDGTFKLWDARTGEFVQSLWQGPLDKDEGFSGAVVSPRGRWIAAAGHTVGRFPDPSVRVWDRERNRTRYIFRAAKPFVCLAFSPDEELLAAGSADNTLTIWELTRGRVIATYRGHEDGVTAVAFRSDEQVVSVDGRCTIRTWDARRAPEYRTFQTWVAWHAALSSDGRRLAAAASQFHPTNRDYHTFVWDSQTGRLLMKYATGNESPAQVAFSPDGERVASAVSIGIANGVVRIFDVRTGAVVRNLPDQGPMAWRPAHLVAQGIAAQALASAAGAMGTLAQGLAALSVLKLKAFQVWAAPCDAVAWSPDGKWIASGGQDRVVRLWDAATGAQVRALPGHARTISALAFSRDGKRLASASGGIIRHTPRPPEPNAVKLPDDLPTDIPDVKVWDVVTGKELHSFRFPGKGPGMALSPDGETLAVTFGETGVNIHRTFFLGGGTKVIWTMLAAPHGDVVRLYDVKTGKERAVLKGHTRPPYAVAFSPDGSRVVTGGGYDETIKLWDAGTGEQIMTIGRHPGLVTSVTFSSDGRQIVSTSDDADVRIWDALPVQK